jgi:hypothetical protein
MRKRSSSRVIAALAVTAATVVAAPGGALAVAGGASQTGATFAVEIRVGDILTGSGWGCSGARVEFEWVLTTATCLRASGAAPATNGVPPLKPVTAAGRGVDFVTIHPTVDAALLRTEDVPQRGNDPRFPRVTLASAAPVAGGPVSLIGYGRTGDEWVPLHRQVADFQVKSTTDTTVEVSPTGAGAVCMGDTGGPAVSEVAGRIELVGLIAGGAQRGCLAAAPTTDRDATLARVDGLGRWVGSWTLNTSFEESDPTPFSNTPAYSANSVVAVGGVCCSLTGPELTTRAERPVSGLNTLMYSGMDTSTTRSFAYMKAYPANLMVTETTQLRYLIWPQGTSPAGGTNSTCVAVDLDFSDGKHLRDLKAPTSNGSTDAHPARQCGHLTMNAWNQVTVYVGAVAAGKRITQVNVGYDQPGNTGGYRGLIDNVSFFEDCIPYGGNVCATGATAAAPIS